MSSRSAGRGSEAARSIRVALRTSSMVAVSSASPSRCFLFWPGRRARIASPIVLATVAIPPTTQPHPLPIRRHASRRRLGCAAQETMGGELNSRTILADAPESAYDTVKCAASAADPGAGLRTADAPSHGGLGRARRQGAADAGVRRRPFPGRRGGPGPLPAKADPIGSIVAGATEVYGEASGRSTIEGAAERTADGIAAQPEIAAREQGWMPAAWAGTPSDGSRLADAWPPPTEEALMTDAVRRPAGSLAARWLALG